MRGVENSSTTLGRIAAWVPAFAGMTAALWVVGIVAAVMAPETVHAQIARPHAQSSEPGPAKSPRQALDSFDVPEGFSVRLVANEPDVVNPVAMTWDDRGRIYVCESVEYPRFGEGPGQDRIRIHIDRDNDGVTDEVKTFADGLNIPSGIEVGYGGVFVANAPDLLFLRDTDGDDVADSTEVLLTGFGRKDTHEVPNSLIWGPDGWLYGLNGVFNPSRIENQGRVYEFTCALWRYHPVTRKFELFSEGTSNPWGLDYNRDGCWFVSACVIDHLWHLTQTGYYHRQGGPYPPNTWKIESIVDFKHQMAAYCGLCFYDADAYPDEYRRQLYMGNIHFGGINRDSLERNGSTYRGGLLPDFMAGNDVWHMPVSQKVGPDGSIWVLDWYDRYHCYQDAMRDPGGIDRLAGRIFRVVYGDAPMPEALDLQTLGDDRLIELLSDPNVWRRRKARRILTERNLPVVVPTLEEKTLGPDENNGAMEALWTLIGMRRIEEEFLLKLLDHDDARFRAWGVYAAAEKERVSEKVFRRIGELAGDDSPDVRLQVAVASSRIDHPRAFDLLFRVMEQGEADPLIPHIVWENLHRNLEGRERSLLDWMGSADLASLPVVEGISPRAIGLLLDRSGPIDSERAAATPPRTFRLRLLECLFPRIRSVSAPTRSSYSSNLFNDLFTLAMENPSNEGLIVEIFESLWDRIADGQIEDRGRKVLSPQNQERLAAHLSDDGDSGSIAKAILASWGNERALTVARREVGGTGIPDRDRTRLVHALALAEEKSVLQVTEAILRGGAESDAMKGAALAALGRTGFPEVGPIILSAWPSLPQTERPQAVNILTGKRPWAQSLVDAVSRGEIPKETLNVNTARRLAQFGDEVLTERVEGLWGKVRTDRDPEREQLVKHYKWVLTQGDGDPIEGMRIFQKACAQCHKIYGEGREVGPDITVNGRDGIDQILSNVLDPNLTIGSGYIAWTVWTVDEEIHTGILVENSDDRVVLKLEGDEQAVIPRSEVADMAESRVSLMPERLEEGMTDQQFRDLIAFLQTSEPPVAWKQLEIPAASE